MSRDIAEFVRRLDERLRVDCAPVAQGSLTRVVGMTLEAVGIDAALGQRCLIVAPGARSVQAEVVGFAADRVSL